MVTQPKWARIVTLFVLGYEAAGGLTGGPLLVAAPDGRYMDMPVSLLNGVFPDFLIPGIILSAMGILSAVAFFATLRRTRRDWFWASTALLGWLIWFVTEIIILQELHWLHLMWGLPVLLGMITAIPLAAMRNDTPAMQKALLYGGILSSLWYLAINVFVPLQYPGYDAAALSVSELSAIGAPTRLLWVLLVAVYPVLFAAFGWGVLYAANDNRLLRVTGALILAYCIFNLYWPPMHTREVIAAGGGNWSDTLHLVWAFVTVVLFIGIMGFGAAAFGKKFRLYTLASIVLMTGFGMLTSRGAPALEAGIPTPMMGIWERTNIGIFLAWVVALAVMLLRENKGQRSVPIAT